MDNVGSDKSGGHRYERILKNTGLFGFVQCLVLLISVIRNKIVAVLLGTTGFGINESFNRSLNLVKSTTDLGLPFSAVRIVSECMDGEYAAELENRILVARTWAFITAVAGTILCVLLSGFFSLWAFEGDRTYTLSFVLMSPVVFFSAVGGGEMAILKGARMLRQTAVSQLWVVALTFCISIPLFYWLGLAGLVPSIVMVSMATMAVPCFYSFRAFPYRIRPLSGKVLKEGLGMIRIGVYFMITSFFGSGAFAIVANWLMTNGNAEITGIYCAGYQLVAWLGMFVFSAMESDFFPRISTVNTDNAKVTEMVNSQVEVALLLMSPMIVGFLVFLGLIVTVFLSPKFSDAVPMASLAVLSLLFKSMTQPMSYVALAKGDSRTYLLQEVLYDVFFVLAVITAYKWWGLKLTGLALTVSAVFDVLSVGLITRKRYGFRFSARVMKIFLIQMPLAVLTYIVVTCLDGVCRWTAGCLMLALSTWISVYLLNRYSDVISELRMKIKNRLGI
ncbi:MAG: oligosaccharide flippase family protein [Bacteroidaceae bacterium]|nr:oligosaccharide flippase family protein [Bacteroidaceae bacterium]